MESICFGKDVSVSPLVSSINLASAWRPHTPIECFRSIELSQVLSLIKCVDKVNPDRKDHAQAAEPTSRTQRNRQSSGPSVVLVALRVMGIGAAKAVRSGGQSVVQARCCLGSWQRLFIAEVREGWKDRTHLASPANQGI